jgi:hypothetical protein
VDVVDTGIYDVDGDSSDEVIILLTLLALLARPIRPTNPTNPTSPTTPTRPNDRANRVAFLYFDQDADLLAKQSRKSGLRKKGEMSDMGEKYNHTYTY